MVDVEQQEPRRKAQPDRAAGEPTRLRREELEGHAPTTVRIAHGDVLLGQVRGLVISRELEAGDLPQQAIEVELDEGLRVRGDLDHVRDNGAEFPLAELGDAPNLVAAGREAWEARLAGLWIDRGRRDLAGALRALMFQEAVERHAALQGAAHVEHAHHEGPGGAQHEVADVVFPLHPEQRPPNEGVHGGQPDGGDRDVPLSVDRGASARDGEAPLAVGAPHLRGLGPVQLHELVRDGSALDVDDPAAHLDLELLRVGHEKRGCGEEGEHRRRSYLRRPPVSAEPRR